MRFLIRLRRQFRRSTYRIRQYFGAAEALITRPGRLTPRIVALSLMMVFAGVLGLDALPRAAEAATMDTTTVVAMPAIQPGNFYSDVRASSAEAAGINLLTRAGVVQGYTGNIFGPSRQINRAEFLKVAMQATDLELSFPAQTCFPDVRSSDWFSPFVCAAKDQGIVSGKINAEFFNGQSYFDPSTTVTYGEALKILTQLFGYEVHAINSAHWAESFYRAASDRSVDLPVTLDLDTPLTRGQSVRLAAAFFAEMHGKLTELRLAESGHYTSSSSSSSSMSSSRSSSSSSRSSSSSSSNSSSSSSSTAIDSQVHSQFLLLGEAGPAIGAAKIFMNDEPLDLKSISITLTNDQTGVDSLLVYDDNNNLLGRARLDPSAPTNRTYILELPSGTFTIDRRTERRFYVRPQLLSRDQGGAGNQTVEVSAVTFRGNGVWSNWPYTQATSETFPSFVTARSMITSITNALGTTAPLVNGTNKTLAAFNFKGRMSDSSAHIDITRLEFEVGQSGGVTLTNVQLGTPGFPDRFPCTVVGTQIVCSSIPDAIGAIGSDGRTLALYGDISIANTQNASLQISLNHSGDPLTAGSVWWNDGTTTFEWVGFDASLPSGTYWKY